MYLKFLIILEAIENAESNDESDCLTDEEQKRLRMKLKIIKYLLQIYCKIILDVIVILKSLLPTF